MSRALDEVRTLSEVKIWQFDATRIPVNIRLREFVVPDREEDVDDIFDLADLTELIDDIDEVCQYDVRDAYAAGCRWLLTIGVYCPPDRAASGVCVIAAPQREQLAELVRRHVLPLYQTALAVVGGIVDGSASELCAWKVRP